MIKSLILKNINFFYNLNHTKIIILGNQKSGTTVIAKLLALNTGESVLLDSPLLWEPNFSKIYRGEMELKDLINQNKYYFSRSIIKEPNLTFLYEDLIKVYSSSVKYLFIVRDPRDNIRSLLNRINVPGDLEYIGAHSPPFTIHEKNLFDKELFAYSSSHYIEQLAERWVKAIEVFLKFKENFYLVRYEDFMVNKIDFIDQLSKKMGYVTRHDISTHVNVQYQPQGNRNISWDAFFGVENLARIEQICSWHMKKLSYPI